MASIDMNVHPTACVQRLTPKRWNREHFDTEEFNFLELTDDIITATAPVLYQFGCP